MPHEIRGALKAPEGSTRLLSTEELFEGFNELYESAEPEPETAGSNGVEAALQSPADKSTSHLEITESGEAFSVRAELPSFDSPVVLASPEVAQAAAPVDAPQPPKKARKKARSVLRAIDLLADADRENITATLKGGMLEVKLRKGRVESLAAARSALLGPATGAGPGNA